MSWWGSVFAAQCVVGGGSINYAVVCADRLAALAVSMRIYGDCCRVAGGTSDDQADGAAKTKCGDTPFPWRKNVENIGPGDGFGLRR